MAGEDRPASSPVSLEESLERRPHAFDLFQALRRLECAHRDKPRLGSSLRPVDDPVRLAQEPSLAFAPSTVASYDAADEGRPARLSVFSFGLFGPNGPLPLHLTEYARDRLRNASDPTLVRFLDVFHHRMLALFYRAWACAQPTVNFDRPDNDRFALYVGALFGTGLPSLRDRDALPDLAKLHYAGHLARQTRNSEGLRDMLRGFFRVRADIEQFVGQWLELPEEETCPLGAVIRPTRLGRSITLGSRTRDHQYRFRIIMGPLDLRQYEDLLPGGSSLLRLVAMVFNYVGDELSWDVRLILGKADVPSLSLGGRGRLGWTTWLATRPLADDPDDLVLDAVAVTAAVPAQAAARTLETAGAVS